MTAAPQLLRYWCRQAHIGIIELANPSKRNALSTSMLQDLYRVVREIDSDPSVRVVVIQSQGPVFSSGHDLQEIQRYQTEGNEEDLAHLFDLCSATMQSIAQSAVPYIAKVDGIATAAGCQLVASCDLAYASSESSRFATPGVNLGLFCSTPGVALSRCVPRKHAMEMLLTGELISADKAQSIGLINNAVPKDELDSKVDHVANLVSSRSQKAIQEGKPAFLKQIQQPLDVAYKTASATMCSNVMTEDCKEGISAFFEKRKPAW